MMRCMSRAIFSDCGAPGAPRMLSANRLSNGHLRPAALASLAMSKEGNAVIQLVGR